jgi:hypothetical protein
MANNEPWLILTKQKSIKPKNQIVSNSGNITIPFEKKNDFVEETKSSKKSNQTIDYSVQLHNLCASTSPSLEMIRM